MSKKFGKDRSVSESYAKVPIAYTGIKHPTNPNKELVLIDDFGKHYTACWRNRETGRVGITKLVLKTEKGFMFKGKDREFGSRVF